MTLETPHRSELAVPAAWLVWRGTREQVEAARRRTEFQVFYECWSMYIADYEGDYLVIRGSRYVGKVEADTYNEALAAAHRLAGSEPLLCKRLDYSETVWSSALNDPNNQDWQRMRRRGLAP